MGKSDGRGWPESMTVLAEEEPFQMTAGPVVLRRDTGKNPGAGICAGIARYLQIDVIYVRLAFVLLTIGSGIGLLLYIIGYFLIPRAAPEDRVGFDLGTPQLRTTRVTALLGTIAVGLVATAVAVLPNFDAEQAAPLALVAVALVVFVLWRLRR
jgi:phage shock protein PspC (stress-responsive transcriptional regulator)